MLARCAKYFLNYLCLILNFGSKNIGVQYLQSLGDFGNSCWYLCKPSEATVNRTALTDAPLRAHLRRAAGAPPALARKKPHTHRDT